MPRTTKPVIETDVAEQLREAIRTSDRTQYALAKQAGCAPDLIRRFVSGERPDIRLSSAVKLCKILGLRLISAG